MTATVAQALSHAESALPSTLDALRKLAQIPGISADPAPNAELAKSAANVAAWMTRIGLERVEVLELPGVHPYVYGEWLHAPGAPTVLLYAHHDVQPPGRPTHWKSPAFEPAERDGRLYGRGVVDDKAGAAIHFAAVEAYLKNGGLPLNVKIVIDGEEEIGSEHLEEFLAAYRERLDADVIVLTDTANLAAGLPSITYALRGIVVADVELRGLDHPLHSGMWGGPIPDPAMAMCKLLASLVDDHGRLAIPGIYEQVQPLRDVDRARLAQLPYEEAAFRKDAGLLDGVAMSGEPGFNTYELSWHRPSLTISALEAAPLKGASNQIVDSARARIGIRTVPNMVGSEVADSLCAHLKAHTPWGMQLTTKVRGSGGWWTTTPEGPAFSACERALKSGFGVEPVYIGCGGSIPFVEPFARVLGGVPALLVGLEDPICNAHSENESLLISDFQKAIASAIHLYDELSRLPR
ncbi:MAG: dipeptidase [Myxococcales bacterium]|nr:dipeptidase [Myxococcales bacterium]